MGKFYVQQVNAKRVYVCASCLTPLTSYKDLLSKNYILHDHQAFLFSKWVNLCFGETKNRSFKSGYYQTKATFCKKCKAELGYFYEYSFSTETRNVNKEGKVILQENLIKRVRGDEDKEFARVY